MSNRSGIYQIRNVVTGMVYVGSAVSFNKRFASHKRFLRNNKHPNRYLQSAWNKYWEQSFVFQILEIIEDKTKLIEREQYWINWTECYNREFGYNLRKIPNSNLGLKFTDDTKRKMSVSATGKIVSDEFRKKMILLKTGFKHTKETKLKLSLAHTGKKLSDEHKLNMSLAHKGIVRYRKIDKWPCKDGYNCYCNLCKQKHNEERNKRNRNKKEVLEWRMVNV